MTSFCHVTKDHNQLHLMDALSVRRQESRIVRRQRPPQVRSQTGADPGQRDEGFGEALGERREGLGQRAGSISGQLPPGQFPRITTTRIITPSTIIP